MASTPRYVGNNAATARAYLCAALGWKADDFLRVFDLDGDGAVADVVDDDGNVVSADETAFLAAVCMAETEVDEALAASHGAPFTGAGINDSVRQVSALRVPWCAIRGRGLADAEKSGEKKLWDASDARLKKIREDAGARIPQGTPEPYRSAGVVDLDERSVAPGQAYARNARGGYY